MRKPKNWHKLLEKKANLTLKSVIWVSHCLSERLVSVLAESAYRQLVRIVEGERSN